ncbi:MAG: hypothetical protein AAF432_16950, partial [Planctomycetota bacterium]
MKHANVPNSPRAQELLLDRALFGLEPDESNELSSLLGEDADLHFSEFDRVVAEFAINDLE